MLACIRFLLITTKDRFDLLQGLRAGKESVASQLGNFSKEGLYPTVMGLIACDGKLTKGKASQVGTTCNKY